jgi:hypothetical protein
MRVFPKVTIAIGAAFVLASSQSAINAQEGADCLNRCLLSIQYTYPNSPYMTPEQQYQERQREYRERKNDEYYQNERNKREQEQQIQRGRTTYGAIAYSPDSGNYGYSQNYDSRGQAEGHAKRECGKGDCEIAAWFYNSCGALATDDDEGSWGGAQGGNEARARQAAVARCVREGGKKCKVVASVCSP